MPEAVLLAGIACIVAAVVGGGLRAFSMEIPALNSLARQIMLAFFGTVLMFIGWPKEKEESTETIKEISAPEILNTEPSKTNQKPIHIEKNPNTNTSKNKKETNIIPKTTFIENATPKENEKIDDNISFFSCNNFDSFRVDRNSGKIFDGQIPIYISDTQHGFYRFDPELQILFRYHLDILRNTLSRQGIKITEESYKSIVIDVMNKIQYLNNSKDEDNVEFGRQYVANIDQEFQKIVQKEGRRDQYSNIVPCAVRYK